MLDQLDSFAVGFNFVILKGIDSLGVGFAFVILKGIVVTLV